MLFSDKLIQDLEKLQFTFNESKVYLTLLTKGKSLAGTIAKEARLDRSSTYNALNSLVKKGIVSTMHENKRTIYFAEKPQKILDYFKEKEELAKNVLPSLEHVSTYTESPSTVKLYQGFKGIKTVMQDILQTCDSKTTHYILGSEGQFSERMPYYAPLFRKIKEEKGIKTRIIMRNKREEDKKSKLSEYAMIPSQTVSPIGINIYANKVAILIWDENPKAILIESTNVAKTLADYSAFIWKFAEKV